MNIKTQVEQLEQIFSYEFFKIETTFFHGFAVLCKPLRMLYENNSIGVECTAFSPDSLNELGTLWLNFTLSDGAIFSLRRKRGKNVNMASLEFYSLTRRTSMGLFLNLVSDDNSNFGVLETLRGDLFPENFKGVMKNNVIKNRSVTGMKITVPPNLSTVHSVRGISTLCTSLLPTSNVSMYQTRDKDTPLYTISPKKKGTTTSIDIDYSGNNPDVLNLVQKFKTTKQRFLSRSSFIDDHTYGTPEGRVVTRVVCKPGYGIFSSDAFPECKMNVKIVRYANGAVRVKNYYGVDDEIDPDTVRNMKNDEFVEYLYKIGTPKDSILSVEP